LGLIFGRTGIVILLENSVWVEVALVFLAIWGCWRIALREFFLKKKMLLNAPMWDLKALDTAIVVWVVFACYLLLQYGLPQWAWPMVKERFLEKEWRHCASAIALHLSVAAGALTAIYFKTHASRGRFQGTRPIFSGFEGYCMALPLVWLTSLFWSKLLEVMVSLGYGVSLAPQSLVGLIEELQHPELIVIFGLLAVVTAPWAEELLFRRFLYPFLKQYLRPNLANLLTAITFAYVHGNTLSFLPLFLFSLLLAYAYEETGSLKTPFMMHSLFNFQNFLMIVVDKG
jgi:membrane protease YdiL (CAAX protease family)